MFNFCADGMTHIAEKFLYQEGKFIFIYICINRIIMFISSAAVTSAIFYNYNQEVQIMGIKLPFFVWMGVKFLAKLQSSYAAEKVHYNGQEKLIIIGSKCINIMKRYFTGKMQGERRHWTENCAGTLSFIDALFYFLA